jgi:hypothetical protein
MNTAQIPGFSNYLFHADGRVESWQGREIRFLDAAPQPPRGYRPITLIDDDGHHWRTRLHVAMATAFHGSKPFAKAVARHVDGNTSNHCADNCRWGTYKQNEDDKLVHGTWWKRRDGGKLTLEQAEAIRQRYAAGERQVDLAAEYGVSRPTITRIINNSIWRNQHG